MNIAVVEKGTNKLVAYIAEACICDKNYELINYGDNSPIFTEKDGEITVKPNSFELNL